MNYVSSMLTTGSNIHSKHGALELLIEGKDDGVSPVGILFHGFGATAESISEIVPYFLPVIPYWIVPQAPIDISELFGDRSYAWFPSQPELIMEAVTGILWNKLEDESFEELALIAGKIIDECIHPVRQNMHSRPIVLMGYSQGGMVASEVVLQCLARNIAIDQVILFSTCMVAKERWTHLAQKYIREKKSRVLPPEMFQFHGVSDTVLTLEYAHHVKEFWESYTQLQFMQFDGGHELPVEVLDHTYHYLLQKFSKQAHTE